MGYCMRGCCYCVLQCLNPCARHVSITDRARSCVTSPLCIDCFEVHTDYRSCSVGVCMRALQLRTCTHYARAVCRVGLLSLRFYLGQQVQVPQNRLYMGLALSAGGIQGKGARERNLTITEYRLRSGRVCMRFLQPLICTDHV